jgi:hypothetical protein
MKSSSKRATSRKNVKEPRGRKGQEEIERQLTGAGWTTAATQHFIDLATDEERLAHVRAMFTISEEEYRYQVRKTFIADFHLGNGLYCLDQQYDAPRAQFVCRALTELLELVVTAAQPDQPDQRDQPDPIAYDALRAQMLERYQALFLEFNAEEYRFTLGQAEHILRFISDTFIRPLRLIILTMRQEPARVNMPECRKISTPPISLPLSEFSEEHLPSVDEFTPPEFPRLIGLTLADVREAMARYTAEALQVIERRYDKLDDIAQRIAASL